MDEQKRIIEINGIKMEVDMRNVKVLEHYKVGDPVKVLKKEYQNYKSYPGMIIGFDDFKNLPTIIVAYLDVSYSEATLKFIYLNSQSEDVEICPTLKNDMPLTQGNIIEMFDRKIVVKEQELKDLESQKKYFLDQFGVYFGKMIEKECVKD